MEKTTFLKAALAYAANGYYVLPLVENEKRPASPHGYIDATTDAAQIEAWWSKNPNYNVGIVTGLGFIVIDLDVNHGISPNNGLEELSKFEATHGCFPETATCITPRGGRHLYYALSEEQASINGILPGVDILGSKHIVVAPPSVTENGVYQWEGQSILDGISPVNLAVTTLLAAKEKTADCRIIQFPGQNKPTRRFDSFSDEAIIQEGTRHKFLMRRLGQLQRQGLSDEAIRVEIANINRTRCSPPMTEKELDAEIFEALTRYKKGPARFPAGESITSAETFFQAITALDPFHQERYRRLRDLERSRLFADVSRDIIRYNVTAKQWFIYDGTRWCMDEGGIAADLLAKDFSLSFRQYAAHLEMEDAKSFILSVDALGYRSARSTLLKDAESNLAIRQSDFDTQPYLFNCLNCVINLETGEILEHRPELFLSKMAGVVYDPDAQSEDFERFMDQIMMGDKTKIEYLQTLFGYAMSGTNQREEAYMLYGRTTRNGKSTLMDTMKCLFGDYAMNCQPETLAMKNKSGGNASPDLARLNGCRLLQVSEPPKRMNLDVALFKTLTGRDPITARHLYQEPFEFMPVFKLFMNTNYLPIVLDDTLFSSGRVKVITFDRHFEPHEQDMGLKDRLVSPKNLSGILNWLLEGNRRFRENPNAFDPPAPVRTATEAYRLSSDKLQSFLDECTEVSPQSAIPAKEAYITYSSWCKDNGFGVENKSNFFAELKNKGIMADHATITGRSVRNVLKGYSWGEGYPSGCTLPF